MFEQGDSALPSEVARLIDQPQYCTDADIAVDKTLIRAMCAVVQNSNPVFWSSEVAESIVGKQVAPSSLLAAWGRPELWEPERRHSIRALQLHFDLKDLFGYPASLVASFETVFYAPAVIGEVLNTRQVLKTVSDVASTHLGIGRYWTIEMQYRNPSAQLVGIDIYNFFAYSKEQP